MWTESRLKENVLLLATQPEEEQDANGRSNRSKVFVNATRENLNDILFVLFHASSSP